MANSRPSPLLPLGFMALCIAAMCSQGTNSPRYPIPSKPVEASPEAPGAPPAPALEITLSSSDGKKDWIDRAVSAFQSTKPVVNGQPVRVKVVHMRSGESMRDILAGSERPTIWSPVSESWVREINATWALRHGKPLIGATRPVVKSALVVALWEPMARALGWPERPVGWEEIARVALDPRGWAGLGHPEWGRFKFGHAHPDYSTSAMLSVLSEVYAAAGKREGLTEADVARERVTRWVEGIERSIVHYGKSSSWLTEKLVQRGPAYLSGTPLYESSVVRANDKYPNKAFPIVAIYPKEGTFWETHPTGIVEADWVSADQAAAAKLLVNHLTSRPMQELAVRCGFRPADPAVALAAPFDTAHGVDPEQDGHDALAPVPDPVFRAANELWHHVKKKASIAIVLDVSGSMNGAPMDAAKRGVCELIRHMEKQDRLRLTAFSTGVTTLTDGPVSQVGEAATQQVSGLFADGSTALYDAVSQSFREVDAQAKADRGERLHAVVVLTDGKDTASRSGRAALMALLPKVDETESTKVYTIAYGDDADRDLLKEIAERSNAASFDGTTSNIQQIYLDIAAYF